MDGWALLTYPRHVGRKRFAYGRNPGGCVARRPPRLPSSSSSIVDGTSLTNHTYPDLPRILQVLLDLMGNVAGQSVCRKFIDLLRFNDDSHLATRLDSEGFFHAGKRIR